MPEKLKALYQFAGAAEFVSLDDGTRLDFDTVADDADESFLEWSIGWMLEGARRLGRPSAYRVDYAVAGESQYVVFPDDSSLIVNRGISLGSRSTVLEYEFRHYCLLRLRLRGYLEEDVGDTHLSRVGTNCSLIYAGTGLRYGFATPQTSKVYSVTLLFRPEFLRAFLPLDSLQRAELYLGETPAPASHFIELSASPGAVEIGNQLLALDLAPPAARMAGRGLMLQLLGEVMEQLEGRSVSESGVTRLRQRDIERLMAVRKHMDATLDAKHSIEHLGRWGGLNRRKLTEGFKVLFGTTVADYLLARRMAVALEMLGQGDPVAIVAAAVGYRNQSSFSRAFRRFYGGNPTSARCHLRG